MKNKTITFSQEISIGGTTIGNVSGKIKDIRLEPWIWVGSSCGFKFTGSLECVVSSTLDALSGESHSIEIGGIHMGPFGYMGILLDYKFEISLSYTMKSKFELGGGVQEWEILWNQKFL